MIGPGRALPTSVAALSITSRTSQLESDIKTITKGPNEPIGDDLSTKKTLLLFKAKTVCKFGLV